LFNAILVSFTETPVIYGCDMKVRCCAVNIIKLFVLVKLKKEKIYKTFSRIPNEKA
jgi:hypothetical protein